MKPEIQFFFIENKLLDGKNLINETLTKKWISHVIESESEKVRSLNIILCDDNYLLELNKKYLDHDTLTDIITFYYHNKNQPIEGELYISLERVLENADLRNIKFLEELDRVIIHGVLHLLGYNDDTEEEKEIMKRKEDYCLNLRT